jgi:acyl-CoA reductase-like NAD-dependent aldehyde dehydrogenase
MIAQDTLKNYIGGQWQAASATDSLPVHNPATGEAIAAAPMSGTTDV